MSLRISDTELNRLNDQYDGIRDQILHFESMDIPACSCCGSDDTAATQVGVIGRTMNIALATSKVKLIGNRTSSEGRHFCNACESFFDPISDD
jgi:hypothetical protein